MTDEPTISNPIIRYAQEIDTLTARVKELEAENERLKTGRKYVCRIHGMLRTDDPSGKDLAWCPICSSEESGVKLIELEAENKRLRNHLASSDLEDFERQEALAAENDRLRAQLERRVTAIDVSALQAERDELRAQLAAVRDYCSPLPDGCSSGNWDGWRENILAILDSAATQGGGNDK